MSEKNVVKARLSPISTLHYIKLCYRSLLLVAALAMYIIGRVNHSVRSYDKTWQFWLIWAMLVAEMVSRLFPNSFESMGCQKQFKRNYKPTGLAVSQKAHPWRIFAVAVAWLGLNAVIGVLYYTGGIDACILFIICLVFSVCDIICILFFCPFQAWFMKNRCCVTCRIYNWDFAMMCTPLLFVFSLYSWSLLALSLVILVRWELTAHRRPQAMYEDTNACLSCDNCTEKLCTRKKQLQQLLKKSSK